MKARRDIVKAIALGAGALNFPGVASAQNAEYLPPIISLLLEEQQFVIPAASSASVDIAIAAIPQFHRYAASSVSVDIAIAPA